MRWIWTFFVMALMPWLTSAQAQTQPNIVFFWVDDMGYTDPGFMGSDYHLTPHIDALAESGMVFTAGYANAPNCAPSRAAFMSGTYAPRTGVYTVGSPHRGQARHRRLNCPPNAQSLDPRFTTIAQVLQQAGYATCHAGKWHLGDVNTPSSPEALGFDVNIGGFHRGHPPSYFSPYNNPALTDGPRGEYLTDRLTTDVIDYLTTHHQAQPDQPFFLYFPFYTVHTPIQPDPARLPSADRPRGDRHHNRDYAAMVESLDHNIGRVLETLEAQGQLENTIIIFSSDNGGVHWVTDMQPLRGAKGMLYEGGIRVPYIVCWPGVTASGSTSDEPVFVFDLYPTLAAAAGGELPAQPIDGVDLTPVLSGEAETLGREAMHWHFPAYLQGGMNGARWRTTPAGAVRMGDWKLIEYFEDGRLELYNLADDLSERNNLADSQPERAQAMRQMMVNWRRETNAAMPTGQNPRYRP